MPTNGRLVANVEGARGGLITGLKTENTPVFSQTSIGGNGIFVSKNCKNPEAAARLIEFLYSQEGRELTTYGREGIDWTRNADGTIKPSDEILKIRTTDPERFNKEWNGNFLFGKQLEQNIMEGAISLAAGTDVAKEIVASSDYNKSIVVVNPRLRLILPKADTKDKITYDKLIKVFEDYEAKMILAESEDELMKTYEDFKKLATKMGAEKLEKTLTEK